MYVHQSPRRHSGRLQNAYEDGTDEDEQLLLQPADRTDQRERAACSAMGSLRSSPQDQHPRHTQLQDIPSRKFADRQRAANDVPFGPNPDVPHSAYYVGERSLGTEHVDPTYSVGAAALPPSQHRPLPTAPFRQQTPSLQHSSDPVHGRLPPPPGYYISDSPYPEPSMHNVRKRLSSPELSVQSAPMGADGQGRKTSSTVRQSTTSACREDHPQQRTFNSFDPGGGRGLFSSSFEPFDSVADLEQKSAFYRNAAPYKPGPYALKPLDLPKFDGDIRKYPQFREAFEEVYGSHPDVAPRNKLLYLRMHLLGELLAFAETYMVDDEAYATVLEQLDEKYGNKGRLLVTLCQDLANIQPPSEELNDLRRFCQEVGAIQSSFRLAGETLDNSPVYEMQISTKLPKSIRLKLVDSDGYRPASYSTTALLDGLNKYVANLAWAGTELRVAEEPTDGTPVRNSVAVDTSDLSDLLCHEDPELTPIEQAVNTQRAAAAVATTYADEHLEERRTCPLCGYLHSAADCTVYDTTKKRLRRVQKLKMCILCLREGHPAASCPRRTTHPCKICGHGQHNRALCMVAIDGRQRTVRHPSQVRATKGSNTDPEASDQQRHSRTSAPARSTGRSAQQSVNRDNTNTVLTATTMRQSGTQSSLGHIHGNLVNRKKRPKDLGTDPHGRPGTNRLSTTSTDESIKQNGAEVYGSDRILPGRYDLLRTDRCPTNREMLQLDRTNTGGSADAEYQYELYDNEDFSHQPSKGLRFDAVSDSSLEVPDEPRFHPSEESNVYVACASDSDEQPAVLHECLAVTAMNPDSKKSRRAVIMFDSGSNFSQVSSKLAHALDLPRTEMQVRNVNIFGSKTPMALNGFCTFLVLRSEQGRILQVNVTVVNCIVTSVRTALVRDADLPALRRSECIPTPTREMPDLLIGQDLVHLFNRRLQPTLPSGFYIVRTSMGPMIGGARQSVPLSPKGSTSSCPLAALPAGEDTDIANLLRRAPTSLPSSPASTTGRLYLRQPDLSLDPPTYFVAGTTDSFRDDHAYSSAYYAGNTVYDVNNELPEPSTSTLSTSRHPSPLTRASGVLPRSPQKQLLANPLDAQLLLLPTYSTTHVEVEGDLAAYFATELPRLIKDLLSLITKDLVYALKLPAARTPTADEDTDLPSEASTSSRSCSFAWTNPDDAEEPVRQRKISKDSKQDEMRPWLNICPIPQFVYPPTYSVGDTAVTVTIELVKPSSSLQIAPERLSSFRVPSVLPQSPQKHPSPKPLDTLLLLLPTNSSTNGDVEVVPAAYYALTPPRPSQDSLSSTVAELRRSTPPTTTHGDLTSVSFDDARSTIQRKTRLRPCLPECARQLLGIYTAPEPVTAVTVLLSEATLVSLRAERHFQLVLISHSPGQTTIVLPVSPDQCPYALLPSAVLFLDASAAVSNGFSSLKRPPPAATEHLRMFGRPGSRHDFLRRLRSSRDLPTHARTTNQCLTSATNKPSFFKGWLPGCTQPTMARRKRKPTSCTLSGNAQDTALRVQTNNGPRSTVGRRKAQRSATGRQSSADLAKTAEPSVYPTYSVGSSGYARQTSNSKPAVRKPMTHTPSNTRRPTDLRTQKSLTATAPTKAKPSAKEPATQPRALTVHAQASCATNLLCWSVNSSCSNTDTSKASNLLCWDSGDRKNGTATAAPLPAQTNRSSHAGSHSRTSLNNDVSLKNGPATITGAPHSTLPPRGPRADLADQKLRAPRRPPAVAKVANAQRASQLFSSAHYEATRATQEPLEHLEVSPSPQCVFCGQTHSSSACDAYATHNQRLRRAWQLKCCFMCLGRDHLSSSCPVKNTIRCDHCHLGLHHEALCHDADPPAATNAAKPDSRRAPTFSAQAAAAPTTKRRAPTTSTQAEIAPATSRRAPSVPDTTQMRRTCAFCQKPHWSSKCTAYATITQRLRRSQQLELCYICLRAGHLATSCPTGATLCKLCSSGRHHRAMCRRATTQSTGTHANGTTQRKKRLDSSRVRPDDRNVCPPKNETICFCDASTFHQFGRQLRLGVQMIATPMSTPADASNFVCSFRPTKEVQRVIFWFSSNHACLNHVELVRLVIELSQYYTTHYQTILQYVVVSPSVSSRQDVWTYGIFTYLVQAEVLLLDAQLTTLPQDFVVEDAKEHQAIDSEDTSSSHHHRTGHLLNATEDVKRYLRNQHQLDLWGHYRADEQFSTATACDNALPAKVATYFVGSEVVSEHHQAPIVSKKLSVRSFTRASPATCYTSVVVEPTPIDICLDSASIADLPLGEPTAHALAPIFDHQTNDADHTGHGLVKVAAYSAASETPSNTAITAGRNHCVPDVDAKATSGAINQPRTAPISTTASAINAPTIVASATNHHCRRAHSDRRRRRRDQEPAPQAHGLDIGTEPLAAIAEQGP